MGKFSKTTGSPTKTRAPSAFSAYVKENFAAAKAECAPGVQASEVMKLLSAKWAAAAQKKGVDAGREEEDVSEALFGMAL